MSVNRNYEDSPTELPEFAQIGHTLGLAGILFSGMGEYHLYLLPAIDPVEFAVWQDDRLQFRTLSSEEWSALLKRSDDPLVYIDNKAWVRKLQYQISGDVQQKVWARDGFKCQYCGRKMGEVTLSIDHFVPLELGGRNSIENYISACRRCNKDKGNMPPQEWCKKRKLSYDFYVDYLLKVS